MSLATRIKQLREIKGLTQSDLANIVGITQQSYGKIEDGTTQTPRKILELAQALQCNPNWLMNGTKTQKQSLTVPIVERINSRLKILNLKRSDLSNISGINKASISQWYSGRNNPSGKNLLKLANILQCNPNWLLTGVGDNKKNPPQKEANKSIDQYPLISWTQACSWDKSAGDNSLETIYYNCPKNCSNATFLLKVRGESMEPLFHQDDLIYIDPNLQPSNKSFVITKFADENEPTFKQLIIEGDQSFLKSINTNWPIQYRKVNSKCRIIGVVFFMGREI